MGCRFCTGRQFQIDGNCLEVGGLIEIKRVDVRVAQRITALVQRLVSLDEVLTIHPRVRALLLHLLDLGFRRDLGFGLHLQRLVVVREPRVVVQIPLERRAGIVFLVLDLVLPDLVGVVLVAGVVGPGVVFPRPQAYPAPLVLTRSILASDMVTAAVFFDRRTALGARLGVRHEPIVSLGVVLALDQPTLEVIARTWPVVVKHATEAETVLTQAPDAKLPLARLDGTSAVGCRAPLDVRILVYK